MIVDSARGLDSSKKKHRHLSSTVHIWQTAEASTPSVWLLAHKPSDQGPWGEASNGSRCIFLDLALIYEEYSTVELRHSQLVDHLQFYLTE
jgi:hypothetical protein